MKFQEYLEDILDQQIGLMSGEELAEAHAAFEAFSKSVKEEKPEAHPDMRMKLADLRARSERLVKSQKWALEKQGKESEGGKLADAAIKFGEALLAKKAKKAEFVAHAEMNSQASRVLNAELVAAKAAEKIAAEAAEAVEAVEVEVAEVEVAEVVERKSKSKSKKQRPCNLGHFKTDPEFYRIQAAKPKPKHCFHDNISKLEFGIAREAAYTLFNYMDLETAKLDLEDYKNDTNKDLTFERISECESSPYREEDRFYTLTEEQFLAVMDAVIKDLELYESQK